jgi:hypothetical protein
MTHQAINRVDASGLAFIETSWSSKPKSRNFVDEWFHKSVGGNEGIEYQHEDGASPLRDMALRAVLPFLDSLNAEHFKGLPWPVMRRLWDMITQK